MLREDGRGDAVGDINPMTRLTLNLAEAAE
jgi:hypothetical protein